MSDADPNGSASPASECSTPRSLSPTTSLRTKKSRNTLYRYFFGADGRATRKDVPGEEFDPDFSDMPGTPEIRAAAARRVAIRRALGGVTMLSTLSDEELEEMTDAARVMDFTPPENAHDDRKIIHARGETVDGFYVVLSGDVGVRWAGDGVGGWPGPNDGETSIVPVGQCLCVRACVYTQPLRHDVLAVGKCSLIRVDRESFRRCFDAESGAAPADVEERRDHARYAAVSRLLRALPYTRDLMDEEVEECARMFRFKTYERGTPLVNGGKTSKCLVTPLSGLLATESVSGVTDDGDGDEKSAPGDDSRWDFGNAWRSVDVAARRDVHTGWFGLSALIVGETVRVEPVDVVVQLDADVAVLDAAGCDAMTDMIERKDIRRALRGVDLLRTLSDTEIEALTLEVSPIVVEVGETIIAAGDSLGGADDAFYIIHRGEFEVRDRENREIIRLHRGDHFGERSLLSKADSREADCTCSATATSYLFSIKRAAFERHMGPLRDHLDRHDEWLKELEAAKGIDIGDLMLLPTLGVGTFGRVRLVEHRETGKAFALKSMSKSRIAKYRQQSHVRDECLLMRQISHPFCARLIKTYRDELKVHMLLEATLGGELFRYLDTQPGGKFPEDWCRFYAACVVLALEHMHSQGIVYRDLKPENLLLDRDGYIKVVDYGFAKKVSKEKTYTVCGTPDYIAPEIISRRGHDRAVDLWALGVLVYEMVTGLPPFSDEDTPDKQIYDNISNLRYQSPRGATVACNSLIKALLVKTPGKRLGCGRAGLLELKRHAWFGGLDWKALIRKEIPAPVVPVLEHDKDTRNYEKYVEKDDPEPAMAPGTSDEWADVF